MNFVVDLQSVKVSTTVFNVFVDPSGDILFAATPVIHKFLQYFYEDPTETCAPSQVNMTVLTSV